MEAVLGVAGLANLRHPFWALMAHQAVEPLLVVVGQVEVARRRVALLVAETLQQAQQEGPEYKVKAVKALQMGATVEAADMLSTRAEVEVEVEGLIVVVAAVAVAVVAVLAGWEPQAHPVQVELERKAPQAPRGKHLPAQQTSPPTQAGRCPS